MKTTRTYRILLILTLFFGLEQSLIAQINDDCSNAIEIVIPNAGWDLGTFTSDTVDLTTATLQVGEFIHANQIAQDKSVWYKFSIPTTRNARITLNQPGPPFAMASTDAGWTLFEANTCLPVDTQVVDPPILNIEGYEHKCLKAGDYLIQVTGKLLANGPVYMDIELQKSTAAEIAYDETGGPYNFGVISGTQPDIYYEVGCQSIVQSEVTCPNSNFTKSTWHVFTTDNQIDYYRFQITEFPWNSFNPDPRVIGYRLYEGNSIIDPIPDDGPGLTTIDSCKTLSFLSNNTWGVTYNPCELKPNTTYSIQLLFEEDYAEQLRIRIYEVGGNATVAPDPSAIPPSRQLGLLTTGTDYYSTDYFSCTALSSNNPCGTVVEDTVLYGGTIYDMSFWYTFETGIDATVTIDINQYYGSQPGVIYRLFSGDVMTDGCNIPLYGTYNTDRTLRCLPAGKYSVQVLGRYRPDLGHTQFSSLGDGVRFRTRVDQVALEKFGLHAATEFNNINNGNPLVSGNTYTANIDYFDCRTTVMPDTTPFICGNTHNRAIYRVITIGQDGILTLGGGNYYFNYRLYQGDASALPVVGGVIQGLSDMIGCQPYLYHPSYRPKVCVTPGKYTLVSFGADDDVTRGDNPWVKFESFPPTSFTDPNNPEVMDSLGIDNATLSATPTRFNCEDNPLTILGYAPCSGATKQIYREVYIDSVVSLRFIDNLSNYSNSFGTVRHRMFRGRISDGSLTGLERDCFTSFNQTICQTTAVGWYTIVTYATGNTFANPEYNVTGYGEDIGDQSYFTLTTNPIPTAKFNTFAKAEQVNGGIPLSWGPSGAHTAKIPYNQKTYTLGTETFVCAPDTPFPAGITPCTASQNRVSYRVFTLDKPSFTYIYNLNPWPYNYQSRLYAGDITGQVPPFAVVQECITDQMRNCLPAGTYTLVSFATDAAIDRTMTPIIYIDSLGTSKYDQNSEAYDFGDVPNDNTTHWGNVADTTDSLGRNPSNDIIFCSTTASASDPTANLCYLGTNPPGNALPSPTNPRQNLWYTFTVTGPGNVFVNVNTLTPGKTGNMPFAVYKATGLGDSTTAGGLQLVASSRVYPWWCTNYREVSFYRDPCSALGTDRYYVLVDRQSGYLPNVQLEVGVRFAPAPPTFVLYDHYSQANVINANPTTTCIEPYTSDTLTSGTYTGCEGNLNCATKDATDQNTCGTRTIWYKFEVGSTGTVRINYDRPNGSTVYNANDIQLYKSLVAGDSTTGGLVRVPMVTINSNANPDYNPGTNYSYGQGCMTPGTYYIMFTGCSYPTETVVPRIWLIPLRGDLCSDPGVILADSAGVYTENLVVDCFSIGEAPGEDGSNMGCLGSPVGMKSAWFKVDLTDTTNQKMDVDIRIDENTNVTSDKIKYRIAYGDCNGMTFDNCVSEGVFVILNLKCRLPQSSIWVQAIMPGYALGDITLSVTTKYVSDSNCVPIDPTKPRTDFDYTTTCVDEAVQFTNYSTSGPGVSYFWDFGDGFTSTLENPSHTYAVADTYFVTLVTDNSFLKDTLVRAIILNEKPNTYFTTSVVNNQIFIADSVTITNVSTNAIPLATYFWDFCAGTTCGANIPSYVGVNPPKIKYNVAGNKKICLTISNGTCDSIYCYSFFVADTSIFSGGAFDGHQVAFITDSCNLTDQNIFVGGPYDGHENAFITDSCSDFTLNVFAGGSYDGHGNVYITDSCSSLLINLFAGGPFDGHAYDTIKGTCGKVVINVFAGGIYDGHGVDTLRENCVGGSLNLFAGGPYDGHAMVYLTDTCSTGNLNIFAGGIYDGFDVAIMYCDTIPVVPPDSTYCDTCFFAGGPFDGHAVAFWTDSCPVVNLNLFSGGPYDGHGTMYYTDSCTSFEINFFAGGPYDGHGNLYYTDSCSSFEINLFAGGPYDGHQMQYLTDSCSKFGINLFAGGPYDGHGSLYYTDSCSTFLINLFAGGPYDGHDDAQLTLPAPQPFTVNDDTVCTGSSATLTTSAPTDWFTFDGINYTSILTNDSILVTAAYTSPGTYIFYVDNPFGCEKIPIVAYVYDTLQYVSFLAAPACNTEISTFTNQTLVPTVPSASLGSLVAFDINSVGTTGIPPGVTQISFSSVQTLNYSNLFNGVNDQNLGWVANNGGVSTEWVQWNYLRPKSLSSFEYWPRNNCCADKAPIELRVYYDIGMGWQLAKTINPSYPSVQDFNSGVMVETANIFANRWKIEIDVLEPNSPQWGEFLVYASDQEIGGNTLWDFGDGTTSTAPDPSHVYTDSGTYNVTLTVDVPGSLCPSVYAQTINVCYSAPLPFELFEFDAVLVEDNDVMCDWRIASTEKVDYFILQKSKYGKDFETVGTVDGNSGYEYFQYLDTAGYLGKSYYRVVQKNLNGDKKISNMVAINIEDDWSNSISIYPNPTNGQFSLNINSNEEQVFVMEIKNIVGQTVSGQPIKLLPGVNKFHFNLSGVENGAYIISIKGEDKVFNYKLIKVE